MAIETATVTTQTANCAFRRLLGNQHPQVLMTAIVILTATNDVNVFDEKKSSVGERPEMCKARERVECIILKEVVGANDRANCLSYHLYSASHVEVLTRNHLHGSKATNKSIHCLK